MSVNPLEQVEVVLKRFAPGAGIPNHPELPAVILRGALRASAAPCDLEHVFADAGWSGMWQWSVFSYHHYHPNAHEVLACVSGRAELMLGGPDGERLTVSAGDVLVLPAGTGHRNLGASPDFSVCGAYPRGQECYDTVRAGDLPLDEAARRIAAVPLPRRDPIYGAAGPLVDAWSLGS